MNSKVIWNREQVPFPAALFLVACLKSPKSFLDTVSTGSDSDLVNGETQES
jgi:hypothetical protein